MLPKYEIRKSDLTVKRNDYDLLFEEHIHKYIEIVYVLKGNQKITIDGEEYNLGAGYGAAIFPETIHSYNGNRQKGSEVVIIICAPKLFGALFPNLNNFRPDSPLFCADEVDEQLRYALCAIRPETEFHLKFSWTCVIMSYILDIMKPRKRGSSPVSDMTYKIIKYIEENFTEEISRADLAKRFNVSECYVSKIFSDKLRMNLRSYLGLLRAEYAASLIRSGDIPFTEICRLSGFGSIRTFNRIFKAAYGISPKEYKNNIIKFISGEKE